MLRLSWPVLARPTYSSMSLGGWPAAATRLGCDADAVIAGQVAYFAARDDYDRPPDLDRRLRAAGFAAEGEE